MSKVGTVVKLQHFTHNGRFKRSQRPVYAKIAQEYVSGEIVAENSSDVWTVRPSKDSKAQFETFVVPYDEEA